MVAFLLSKAIVCIICRAQCGTQMGGFFWQLLIELLLLLPCTLPADPHLWVIHFDALPWLSLFLCTMLYEYISDILDTRWISSWFLALFCLIIWYMCCLVQMYTYFRWIYQTLKLLLAGLFSTSSAASPYSWIILKDARRSLLNFSTNNCGLRSWFWTVQAWSDRNDGLGWDRRKTGCCIYWWGRYHICRTCGHLRHSTDPHCLNVIVVSLILYKPLLHGALFYQIWSWALRALSLEFLYCWKKETSIVNTVDMCKTVFCSTVFMWRFQ